MTMREKMVRAMWEANRKRHATSFVLAAWDDEEDGPSKDNFWLLADAALDAMREPTEHLFDGLGGEALKWAHGVWITAIDAAKAGA